MPTSKPRINITVDPQIYQTYKRLAQLQNRSVSALLNEEMEMMEPGYQKVIRLLERVESTTQRNREMFAKASDAVDGQMTGLFDMIVTIFDAVEGASSPADPSGSGGGTVPRVPPETYHSIPLEPPSSNTGATFLKQNQNEPKINSRKRKPAPSPQSVGGGET